MKSRARLVLFVVVFAAIGLGVSGCNHDTLSSGTEALGVTFAPNPAGIGRFERGTMDIKNLRVLPLDPQAAAVFGTESLQLRLETFPGNDLQDQYPSGILTITSAVPFSNVALARGSYKLTHIEITHPALVDTNVPNPVPSDPAQCMEGVAAVDATLVGAPNQTILDDPAGLLTFTVNPGQTVLSIKLNIPGFIAAYEAAFTCQVGCGSNNPAKNCVIPPFNETAFRTAVLANMTFE